MADQSEASRGWPGTRWVAVALAPLVLAAELGSQAWGVPWLATCALLAVLWLGHFGAAPPGASARQVGALAWLGSLGAGAVGLTLWWPAVAPLLGRPAPAWPGWLLALGRPELAVLLPALGAVAVAVAVATLRGGRFDAADAGRAGLLVGLGFLGLLAAKHPVQFLPVLPPTAAAQALVRGLALLLTVLALVPRAPQWLALTALLGGFVALRALGLSTWTPDPATRDMLPLALSAQDAFAHGAGAYGVYQMQPGSQVPLTYLPGLWGLLGLPRLLGLDLRYAGVLSDAAIVLAAWWAAAEHPPGARRRDARAIVLGLGAAWLASPSVHWNGIYAEPHPWWGVLAWLVAACARRRWWLSAALLALAVLTRHFALVLVPFVAIAMLRSLGWRQALLRLGVAGSLGALVLVGFVARDPESFWLGTYRWLVDYGPAHQRWFYEKYGFSGTLYRAQLERLLPWAQAASAALGVALALLARRHRTRLALMSGTLALFICFNGIVWDSFFLDPFVMLLVLAAGGALEVAPTPRSPERRWSTALAVLGALPLVGAGAWLAQSLWRSQTNDGREQARARLLSLAPPGAAIVDHSQRRLAFVRGTPLLEGHGSSWVGDELFDRRFGPDGALGAPAVWLLSRRDSTADAALRDTLGRLSTDVQRETLGRYELLGLRLEPPRWRLSDAPRGIGGSVTLPGAAPQELRPSAEGLSAEGARAWRRPCRLTSGPSPMVAVLQPEQARVSVGAQNVKLGGPLLLLGVLDEAGQRWGRPAARLELRVDGQRELVLEVPNRPGPFFASVVVSERAQARLEIEVSPAPGPARVLCLDLWRY